MEVKSMQILCNLESRTSSWKKMKTMVHVQNSPQEFEYIYSVILPKFSSTSTLIARDFQKIVVHGGRSAMMQEIRGSCYSWTSLVNAVWKGDKVTWRKKNFFKKIIYVPFLWTGFNCLKVAEPLQEDSLLFITKNLRRTVTHLIKHRKMKGWVDLNLGPPGLRIQYPNHYAINP